MSKLLRAYFYRLKKNRAFWLCICAVFLIAVIRILSLYRQIQAVASLENTALENSYFELLPILGFLSAIVISLFFGTEYSDGTIRNKLIIGCTRTNIYLSAVVISAVVSASVTVTYFIGGLLGIPLLGAWTMPLPDVLLYILAGVLSSIVLSTVFIFISLNCARRAESTVIAILSAFALMILGSIIYNTLQEPQMISGMMATENGFVQAEPHLNPHYVGGYLRTVMTAILHILPSGQQILMANLELTNPIQCICYSLGLTIFVAACGAVLFSKKDIK